MVVVQCSCCTGGTAVPNTSNMSLSPTPQETDSIPCSGMRLRVIIPVLSPLHYGMRQQPMRQHTKQAQTSWTHCMMPNVQTVTHHQKDPQLNTNSCTCETRLRMSKPGPGCDSCQVCVKGATAACWQPLPLLAHPAGCVLCELSYVAVVTECQTPRQWVVSDCVLPVQLLSELSQLSPSTPPQEYSSRHDMQSLNPTEVIHAA